MHLDDERIQRTLHDELPAAERRTVEAHLARCEACRQSLETAREEEARVFALLQDADHALPPVDANSLIHRAHRPSLYLRWAAAAVLVLLVAAGVSYAIPGSPVRAWVDRVLGRAPSATETPAPAPETGAEAAVSGISVMPTGRFAIRFLESPVAHEVSVTLGDTGEIQVRAIGDGASFVTDADALLIRPGKGARFEIELPREASWIEILAGGRTMLRAEGGQVDSDVTSDSTGRYRLRTPASP